MNSRPRPSSKSSSLLPLSIDGSPPCLPARFRFARKVDYYKPEDVPGNIWPQPDLIAATKLARFSYQRECRLGSLTTGVLAFGKATQQLVDRKVRPLPKPEEHHKMTLDPGDLSAICRLHDVAPSIGD